MKRKEILYDALSGISEDKAADAYEYTNYNRKKVVFQNVLKGAGIAAIICSFIVASFILQAVSGSKPVPDDKKNAAAGSEVITEAEVEKETEAEPVTEAAESAEVKRYTNRGENILVDHPTIEELYQTEPYKDFLPSYIPDELVYKWALRFIPGEYLQADGAYYKQTEKTYMYFSTVEGSNSENSLNVYMYHKASVTRPSADEISVSDIDQSGRYYLGVDKVKGTVYSLTFNADGWEITYQYKHLCTEEELLTPEELFDIATSSQYFKDHPLSVD